MYENREQVISLERTPIPLRYKISNWRQLTQCLSNNSRSLHVHITDFIQNRALSGMRISIDHDKFGTLFACVLKGSGDIITSEAIFGQSEISTSDILQELWRYGFFVEFQPMDHLPGAQLEYLSTLRRLGYDKIRLLGVQDLDNLGQLRTVYRVIAFNVEQLPKWLDVAYSPSEAQFTDALVNGSAANLTEVSKTKCFKWDWLTYVANIDDILKDNSGMCCHG